MRDFHSRSRLTGTPPAGRVTSLAVLALAAGALVACGRDAADQGGQPAAGADSITAAAVTTTGEPITDIVAVVTVPDRQPLVGRRLTVSGVKVQTVTGPNTFWVGPNPDQQLFVVRADSARAAADGTARVGPGQMVSVSGVVRQLPDDLGSVRSAWSLSTANEATLTRERVYLDADTVIVTGQ